MSIITVGLSDPSGQVDRKGLGTFAQSEHGAVFWARDAKQVPTIFGRLPAILGGRDIAMDAGIRLESTVPGAFAPGSLVVGTLRVVICPWDCNQSLDIPFAVRIPRQ